MGRRNTISAVCVIVVFMVAVFLPLAGALLSEDRGLSYTEKRKLAQLPKAPERYADLARYVDGLEAYLDDQFGFRDLFMHSYRWLKNLIGDQDISGSSGNVGTTNIIEGKEGWFFLNRKWDGDPFSDYRNIDLYSEGELLRATLLFAARDHWLKSQGIKYLFFFAPNKHTIYSEYIPDYIQKQGELSAWDQLNYALEKYTSVNFVDLRRPLIEAKDQAARYWRDNKEKASLYFRKDSHWNGAGADIAQYEVAKKLAEMFPEKVQPMKRDPEDFIMLRFAGDITLIMGREEKEAYGPVLAGSLCVAKTWKEYQQRNHVTVCDQAQLDALIFNDSFLPLLKPYFSDYFRRVAYFWESFRKARVVEQIRIHKPDVIIEERAERFLPFTPDTRNEQYPQFWQKQWRKWDKVVYSFDAGQASGPEYRLNNISPAGQGTGNALVFEAVNDDPQIYLPAVDVLPDHLYLAKVVIDSPSATVLQIYYSSTDPKRQFPGENESISVPLKTGRNTVYVPLFSLDLGGLLRLDPGKISGRYVLAGIEIKQLNWVGLQEE